MTFKCTSTFSTNHIDHLNKFIFFTSFTFAKLFVVLPQPVTVNSSPGEVEYPGSPDFQGKQTGETKV